MNELRFQRPMASDTLRRLLFSLALLALAGPLLAQPAAQLGQVDFPVSCNEAATAHFDRGIAQLHSFGYSQARRSFEMASLADPGCAMAQWGVAMTHLHPLWTPPDRSALESGFAAASRAAAVGAPTAREMAYITAIGEYYADHETLDHDARIARYSARMEALGDDHPNDAEAHIFYALSLIAVAPADDTTFASQRKAAEILEPLVADHPDHPPGAPGRGPPRSSRHHTLHHPRLRLAGPGGVGDGCCPPLRGDRAGLRSRASHALSHLHSARDVG
jgi:hypothetical protein